MSIIRTICYIFRKRRTKTFVYNFKNHLGSQLDFGYNRIKVMVPNSYTEKGELIYV